MDFVIWYAGLLVLIILWWIINRHIIWWVWYNFFPPIIIWYAIHMFTITHERTAIIILSTILWRLTTKLLTNYINLSLYTRYWLYVIISLWFFITNWIIYTQHLVDSLSMNQSYNLMYLFILIVSMSIKIYSSWKWATSLLWRWHIIWFFTMSFLIHNILNWEYWYTYFMNHGIVVILLAISTLLIWSYTWLQVKEMIRFRKLIWTKITNKKKRG